MRWQRSIIRSCKKQVTTNMTGPSWNIWMFCMTIEQQAVTTIFHNILQYLFWVFWTCLATSIKKDDTILQKLWHLSVCQKWQIFLATFLRYCKEIPNLLLWVIWECLIMPINNDNLDQPRRKFWCPKCWNKLLGSFDVHLHAKNQLHL